jgi:hypothetical protein
MSDTTKPDDYEHPRLFAIDLLTIYAGVIASMIMLFFFCKSIHVSNLNEGTNVLTNTSNHGPCHLALSNQLSALPPSLLQKMSS